MVIAVFDIGGTSIKYGLVDEKGTIMMERSFPTYAHLGGETIVRNVIRTGQDLQDAWPMDGISISTAGQIDNKEGTVVHATDTIPGYTGTRIKDVVQDATGLPVTVENDVNCTALGEYWMGAAQQSKHFLCVTVGTGIGGALFVNGELYTGAHFSAGEIGHMNLYPNGKSCPCGSAGCWERYASSSALSNMIAETYGETMNLIDFFDRLRADDATGWTLFRRWVDDVTTGLMSLVHTLDPELIVIGGGISAQGDFLLEPIRSALMDKVMPNYARHLDVTMAHFYNQANLLGAAKHFLNENQ
ncbi:ROK family protein [Lentibacillus halophilus]|uniref:ROK family protein n=1 Tax=Lentibacillus halophilus TaxID=295065 RepID=A0ABN0Z8F2_9BACI